LRAGLIVSLWDTIEFDVGQFGTAASMLGTCGHTLTFLPNITFHKDDYERIRDAIDLICTKGPQLGLTTTLQVANELKRMWASYGTWNQASFTLSDRAEIQRLAVEMKNTSNFAFRELKGQKAILLSASDVSMISNDTPLFGEEVFNAFSFAREDIEEAGKCLAFQRSTAAVFHLMRALESAARVIANKLGATVTDANGKGLPWGVIAQNMKPKIDVMADNNEKIKWYRVQQDLVTVNRAWRVPTNHPKETYTPDQALEVFDATKAFMKELAPLV
jgi:hypothetical protein